MSELLTIIVSKFPLNKDLEKCLEILLRVSPVWQSVEPQMMMYFLIFTVVFALFTFIE